MISVIPIVINNFIFKRVKAPKIAHRKWHCIELILCHLRCAICRQLSRSLNVKLFITIGISLWASVNEPLSIFYFSGYRNDRIHWHLNNPSVTYSTLYKDVQFWENGLSFQIVQRDIAFCVRGSYAAFGRGDLVETVPISTCTDTHGWAADASGYIGYAVNLTADRLYSVILTPLLGYSGHFEQLNQQRLVWNGFLFGAQFTIEPLGNLAFNVGYAYNILSNRMHSVLSGDLYRSVKSCSSGNMGQSAWAQMDWKTSAVWRIGLGGRLNYFSTRVVDADVHRASYLNEKQFLKLRETSVSGWLQFMRIF